MSIFIVGGDRLGNIEKNLWDKGFTEIRHVSGRKKGDLGSRVPDKADVVLVLTDFICHGLAKKIKAGARHAQSRTLFARRSWVHIERALRSLPEFAPVEKGR